jgi:CHAD domain-containing protein
LLLQSLTFCCLQELGSARDMDFKRLLQLVHTYSDDVQALLEAGQAAALQQQQEYVQQLTADAAAAVGGSIESALAAAHNARQQQARHNWPGIVLP